MPRSSPGGRLEAVATAALALGLGEVIRLTASLHRRGPAGPRTGQFSGTRACSMDAATGCSERRQHVAQSVLIVQRGPRPSVVISLLGTSQAHLPTS
jgi:hypothetical protein